jgi:hypothetical protein
MVSAVVEKEFSGVLKVKLPLILTLNQTQVVRASPPPTVLWPIRSNLDEVQALKTASNSRINSL